MRYYEDAADQVSCVSSEGGYQLPTNNITEILIEEQQIFGDMLDDPSELCDNLVEDDCTPYVRKDPYGPPSGEPEEIECWENLRRVVKNQQRFTIFLPTDNSYDYYYNNPGKFLFHLAKSFMPSLITILPSRTQVYRARVQRGRKFNHADLTSPKPEYARSNRMSPAGISFFYGAMDLKTCIHEVRPDISENVVVAKFEVLQDLMILNLSSEIDSYMSIFNPEYSFDDEEYIKPFLKHFVDDISKPIRKGDNEIEYIPTQIFTEFIKTVNFKDHYYYPDEKGQEQDVFLKGIVFRSSTRKGGENLVLFRGPDISTESRTDGDGHWLLYKEQTTYQVTEIAITSIPFSIGVSDDFQ